jgi:hypothetical protein
MERGPGMEGGWRDGERAEGWSWVTEQREWVMQREDEVLRR